MPKKPGVYEIAAVQPRTGRTKVFYVGLGGMPGTQGTLKGRFVACVPCAPAYVCWIVIDIASANICYLASLLHARRSKRQLLFCVGAVPHVLKIAVGV